MGGAWLCVAATDDQAVNHSVVVAAEREHVLVSAAGDGPSSSARPMSVLRRGDLEVAVGTSGRAPGAAAWVCRQLATVVGPEYGVLIDLVAEARAQAGPRRQLAGGARFRHPRVASAPDAWTKPERGCGRVFRRRRAEPPHGAAALLERVTVRGGARAQGPAGPGRPGVPGRGRPPVHLQPHRGLRLLHASSTPACRRRDFLAEQAGRAARRARRPHLHATTTRPPSPTSSAWPPGSTRDHRRGPDPRPGARRPQGRRARGHRRTVAVPDLPPRDRGREARPAPKPASAGARCRCPRRPWPWPPSGSAR